MFVSRQGLIYPSLTLIYVVENELTSSMAVPCLPYNVVFLTLYNFFLSSYSQRDGVHVSGKKNVLGANALAVCQIIK